LQSINQLNNKFKMLNKKFVFSVMLLLGITVSELYPQNTLNLKEKSGTLTSYALNSINKLTFASGNMTVNKKDGSTSAFALTNIRYLNFTNATSIEGISLEKTNLMLYLNPETDQLGIRYESSISEDVQLQILNIQGKVVYQQTLSSQTGTNYTTISVVQLKNGLYLCLLQNGNKLETVKFIKH